jgi:hypothetical protein
LSTKVGLDPVLEQGASLADVDLPDEGKQDGHHECGDTRQRREDQLE